MVLVKSIELYTACVCVLFSELANNSVCVCV